MKLHFCGLETVKYHQFQPVEMLSMGAAYSALCPSLVPFSAWYNAGHICSLIMCIESILKQKVFF